MHVTSYISWNLVTSEISVFCLAFSHVSLNSPMLSQLYNIVLQKNEQECHSFYPLVEKTIYKVGNFPINITKYIGILY